MRPKIAAAASGSTNVREGGGRSGSKATVHPFCPDFPHPRPLVDSQVTHCIELRVPVAVPMASSATSLRLYRHFAYEPSVSSHKWSGELDTDFYGMIRTEVRD